MPEGRSNRTSQSKVHGQETLDITRCYAEVNASPASCTSAICLRTIPRRSTWDASKGDASWDRFFLEIRFGRSLSRVASAASGQSTGSWCSECAGECFLSCHTHTHTRTRVEEKLSAHFRPWWPLVQDMREGLATQLAVPRPWPSRAQALPQPSPHSQALNALPTSARVRRSSWSWRLLDRGHHRHGLFTRLRLQLGLWKCEMQCNVQGAQQTRAALGASTSPCSVDSSPAASHAKASGHGTAKHSAKDSAPVRRASRYCMSRFASCFRTAASCLSIVGCLPRSRRPKETIC